MHRLQIVTFGAVAIVFAVIGVDKTIYSHAASLDAIAAAWLILAMVDILWVLYFTSEEDSLSLYIFNSMGTGGLSPPSRRRRTRTASMHNTASYGGGGGYSAAGIGSAGYDTKLNGSFAPGIGNNPLDNVPPQSQRSANSVAGPVSPGPPPSAHGADTSGPQGINSPLMSTPGNAGIGAGGGPPLPTDTSMGSDTAYPYKAKALYACVSSESLPNNDCADFKTLPFQILRQRTTPMRFPFPRARFWISLTRTASGGKHGKRMVALEVRGASSIHLICSDPCLLCSCAVKLPLDYLTTTSTSAGRIYRLISLMMTPCSIFSVLVAS